MRKRSLLKKFVAAATAAVLIFSMGITAGASSWTGTGTENGSITVHKYSKVTSSSTSNNTGEEITNTDGLGTPLSGAGYTLYELTMPSLTSGATFTDDYTTTVDADGNVTSITMTLSDNTTVTIPAANIVLKEGESFTDSTGTVTFGKNGNTSTLAQGYYLLQESTVPDGYTADDPTIISIPLTNAAGNGYVYDVHVYPKNVSESSITKILDDTSKTYAVGDEIGFTIDASFRNAELPPDDVTSVTDLRNGAVYGAMRVTDTLATSLAYTSSTVHYLTDTNQKIGLTEGTHYNLTADGNTYVWELTNAGIDLIIDNAGSDGNGVTLEINIQAVVRLSNEALTNTAKSYVRKAGATTDPTEPETPPVIVPTGEVVVDKVTSSNAKLAGAQFALATNDQATSFLRADGSTIDDITSLEDLRAAIADPSNASNPIVVATTNDEGYAVFAGLSYDSANGQVYKLVEVEAPSGYQLKEAAIDATLVSGTAQGTLATITKKIENFRNDEIDPDNPKFSLPLTGGTGALLFTIIGILIMATTAIIYIRSKKRSNA